MIRIIFLTCFFLIFTQLCFAQNATIIGTLKDTSGGITVRHATVSIIDKDSILQTFTRSNPDGTFTLNISKPGNYNLLIAHPNYADYKDNITANGSKIDLKEIVLTNRAKLLKEVVIKQKGSIRIKGDTTIYLADSFKVDDNANVEELLKLLPGVEVDKDGKITTQGEQVQKILVDGEEFFGDDPTVATRNLAAKVIDKVEVFDSKSEQAKFTGFDDGSKEKTINLKMKENMNHGVFGKVQAAWDARKLYDNAAMVNAFKNKRKLSGYAINSSTGTTGLDWSDRSKFGKADNMEYDEESGGMMQWSNGEGAGGYNGEGLPNVNNAGVQYSNKWMEGKHELNVNGAFKNNTIKQAETKKATNYIGANNIGSIDTSTSNVRRSKYSGSGKYEWTIDSTATLIVNLSAGNANRQSAVTYNSINTNNDDFASSSNGKKMFDSETQELASEITYKKKLKKLGRTISINGSNTLISEKSKADILGLNRFGSASQNINQQQSGENKSAMFNTKIIYTEPIIKDKLQAELSVASSVNDATNLQITKVQSVLNGQYDTQIDSLSNDFKSNVIGNAFGIKLKYKLKKVNFTIGNTFKYSIFNQVDKIRNLNYDYNRFNLFPTLSVNYKISQFSNLSASYNGATSQPSVRQLQNVYNNTNPLNITIGNPNLRQEYNQNINVNYWNYKAFGERSMWAGLYGGNTYKNMISTINFETTTGRTINSYANINGTYNFGMYSGYNVKIPKTDFKFSINANANISRNPTIVNTVQQINKGGSWSLEPSFTYRKPKKLDATASYSIEQNYYINKSVSNNNSKYFTHIPKLDINWNTTSKIKMGSDVEYINRQAVAPFTTNFKRTIWNAYVTYKFLKQKNLEASLLANDILNQNKGNARDVYGNTVSERNFLTIGRNILVRVIYNFSKGPVNKLPKEDENDF